MVRQWVRGNVVESVIPIDIYPVGIIIHPSSHVVEVKVTKGQRAEISHCDLRNIVTGKPRIVLCLAVIERFCPMTGLRSYGMSLGGL